MPTNIVVAIDDPSNRDAWGLHPTPTGAWVAGGWPAGTVCSHNNVLWLAKVQTSGEPGISADWATLITVGGLSLDANGFLAMANMPITSGQAKRALKVNGGTGGAAWPGATNWLKIVEDALAADEGDDDVICFNDAFWPIGGAMWTFVQTALIAGLGSFSGAQLADLQTYAITNR
jgi:hypothetical protein